MPTRAKRLLGSEGWWRTRVAPRPPEPRASSSSALRILLLSNVRPSRASRLAQRITEEVPGAAICGIVQPPLRVLPLIQQRLAAADLGRGNPSAWTKVRRRILGAGEALLHRLLWWVHGRAPGFQRVETFTVERLAEACSSRGWPLLENASPGGDSALEFARQAAPDLIVLAGQVACTPLLKTLPRHGLVRILETPLRSGPDKARSALHLSVEHLANDSEAGCSLASLTLPMQAEDRPLGFSLKADLIADDLLVQAVAGLRTGAAGQAAEQVSQWVRDILAPYLAQLPSPRPAPPHPASRALCRSRLRLCLESLLLVSPFVMGRNWLRRWRRRYPVLILAYHLVSDRGHRMSISTERFWRQVRFLQRHYRIVSLSEAVRLLRSGQVTVPTVSLTFDDGYADNFVSLRAVAEEAGIPVAIFLTTRPVSLRTEFQHDVVKGERGALPLSWDQVRWWSRRGAEFGSHTRTHANCATGEEAVLREEIGGAKTDLERQLGAPVPFFAFPYGQHGSMSEEAMQVAQSTYNHFLSSFGGENLPQGTGNNVHLYRKTAYAEAWELELDLQSVFDLIKAARRWLLRASTGVTGRSSRQITTPSPASVNVRRVDQSEASSGGCEAPLHEPSAASE